MSEIDAYTSDVVLARARTISRILEAILLMSTIAFLAKLMGAKELELHGVHFKPVYVPIVGAAITFAHGYASWLFTLKIQEVLKRQEDDVAKQAFQALRDKGPLFLRGLMARLEFIPGSRGRVFLMRSDDPTTWLAYTTAFLAFAAMAWQENLNCFWTIANVLFSAFLVSANWNIGARWVIHASALDDPERGRELLGVNSTPLKGDISCSS
jgi:hypothetical protein